MIIYSSLKDFWQNSFLRNEKLIDVDFDSKVFTDHMNIKQKIIMYKSLFFPKNKNIFCNFENMNHRKFSYYKPISKFDNIVSFTDYGTNSFYYNIGTEHILNKNYIDMRGKKINHKNKLSIGWVCSNPTKLKKYSKEIKSFYPDTKFYGHFSAHIQKKENRYDELRNFIHSAQNYIHGMDAHICIENSNEEGFFSAMPAYAIFSGTAPIIMGDNFIHRKIFSENCYIEYNKNLSQIELAKKISKCSEFINSCDEKDFFTDLYTDYLYFLKNANFFERNHINESKKFRNKFIKNM